MSDILVSVVIPVYNKAGFIASTIDSVIAQTYRNLEIVVVDDGSQDHSAELAEGCLAKFRGFKRLIRKPNGGVAQARNVGVKISRGELICLLDGDDKIHPAYIEACVKALENPEYNLVACSVEAEKRGDWIPESYDPYVERYHNVVPTLITFRREVWETIGGYDESFPFNEDWNFFVAAERVPLKIFRLQDKLFFYRFAEQGIAEVFLKETWQWGIAQIITAQEDLYPASKVIEAFSRLAEVPDRWRESFYKHVAIHPDKWLLHLWIGIIERAKGERVIAKERFNFAYDKSGSWLPLFLLAQMAKEDSDWDFAQSALHAVRCIRPDTEPFVDPEIREIKKLSGVSVTT